MKLNEAENSIYTDIDETLVNWFKGEQHEKIEFNYYGQQVFLKPYHPHIRFLKAMKSRGYYIYGWSANGPKWAYEVCTKLGLDGIIDECVVKPTRVLDDSKISSWCRTIFIKEE